MISIDIYKFIISFITLPVFTFSCFAVFSVRGFFVFYQYAAILSKDRKAKDWPSVIGTIVSSSLKKQHRATIAQGNRTEWHDLFIPHIKYTYAVNETIHESSNIGHGIYTRRSDAFGKKLMEHFSNGASVPVYYNPADPQMSILEKRSTRTYGMYIYSIASMFVGLIFLGVWLYQIFVRLFEG